MTLCCVLKEVMVPVLCTLLGVILGYWLNKALARDNRTRAHRDEFARAIEGVRAELTAMSDNVDDRLKLWHINSVRRLVVHAHYFSIAQAKWWAKIDEAWQSYENKGTNQTEGGFLVTREKLLVRLNHLLKSVLESG